MSIIHNSVRPDKRIVRPFPNRAIRRTGQNGMNKQGRTPGRQPTMGEQQAAEYSQQSEQQHQGRTMSDRREPGKTNT